MHSHNKHASLNSEGSIPIIEIRGEGKPMTSAQIRQLEEAANAGPLDTKVWSLDWTIQIAMYLKF